MKDYLPKFRSHLLTEKDLFVSGDVNSPFVQARRIVNPGEVDEIREDGSIIRNANYQNVNDVREIVDEIANNALKYWRVLKSKSFT